MGRFNMENHEEIIIHGRERDLGGFSVHRCLPNLKKRSVGPFVFLDHMGPMSLDETHALDVRPHPHIGLATVTYLFSGRAFHRDSLGSVQEINPGDLNLMIAGKGIVHSERSLREDREQEPPKQIHGVQIWLALRKDQEECVPSFTHWPMQEFPLLDLPEPLAGGISSCLLLGEYQGVRSPVPTWWKTVLIDFASHRDTEFALSFEEQEIAIGIISGEVIVDTHRLNANDLIVVKDPRQVTIQAALGARFIALGGNPYPEPRYIWWNFVSSNKERLRQAAQDWKNQTMGQVPGEVDFIPLPADALP